VEPYREYLQGMKKEDFHVTKELQDEYGYPNISQMTTLYNFLCYNNQDLFDANNNYWWAKTPEEVLYVCSEYFRYADYFEKELI